MQVFYDIQLERRAHRRLNLAEAGARWARRQRLGAGFTVVEPENGTLGETTKSLLEVGASGMEIIQCVVQDSEIAVETSVESVVKGGVDLKNLLVVG